MEEISNISLIIIMQSIPGHLSPLKILAKKFSTSILSLFLWVAKYYTTITIVTVGQILINEIVPVYSIKKLMDDSF